LLKFSAFSGIVIALTFKKLPRSSWSMARLFFAHGGCSVAKNRLESFVHRETA